MLIRLHVLVIKVFINSLVISDWYRVSTDMQNPDIGISVGIKKSCIGASLVLPLYQSVLSDVLHLAIPYPISLDVKSALNSGSSNVPLAQLIYH